MQKDRAMIHIKWSIYLFLITQCYSKFHIMNFESHNYLPNELMWMNFSAEANSKTLLIETMDRKMWRAINAQSLTDDLSSDQTVAAQWGTNWLLAFNALKIKLMTFYHHQSDPELSPTVTNRCSLREGSWVLSTYWDFNSTQTSSGICTYDSSLKVLGRWLVPWTAPASTSSSSSSYPLLLQEPDLVENGVLPPYTGRSYPVFTFHLIESQSISASL